MPTIYLKARIDRLILRNRLCRLRERVGECLVRDKRYRMQARGSSSKLMVPAGGTMKFQIDFRLYRALTPTRAAGRIRARVS